MNYVGQKSTHKEPFYGYVSPFASIFHMAVFQFVRNFEWTYFPKYLQLDARGCKDVYASFDKYVQVDKVEGEKKYEAAQFGIQVRKYATQEKVVPPFGLICEILSILIFVTVQNFNSCVFIAIYLRHY